MADRFPLIVDSSAEQIQELSAGDNLDLTGSNLINANNIQTSNMNVVGVMTATKFKGDGSELDNLPAGGSSLEAIASGTLADGSTVIVNADGTVSVVSGTNYTAGFITPASNGISYQSGATAVYDPSINKVIVGYQNSNNYPTAVVGTISGTTITFGSEQVATYNSVYFPYISRGGDGKIVMTYRDDSNSNFGTSQVGTISGTSISFGVKVVWNSATSQYMNVVWDSGSSKVIVVCKDSGNSVQGAVFIGTVEGTSIDFGSASRFGTGSSTLYKMAYNSTENKTLIVFRDDANSSYGKAVVGTVSGSGMNFGSLVTFSANGSTQTYTSVYDSANNKIVITYYDSSQSRLKALVMTISGTSVSYGAEKIISSTSGDPQDLIRSAYDATNGKIVVAYMDGGNSNYGTSVVGTVDSSSNTISFDTALTTGTGDAIRWMATTSELTLIGTSWSTTRRTYFFRSVSSQSTNLTAENYIGISDGAYSDGQTATVQLIGSVDDAQSGLTPGSKYYVQNDGTLSTTAGNPSVLAGTAVATTKLKVKN